MNKINLRANIAFAKLEFHNASIYRISFWLRFIFVFILMYSMGYVWRALYAANPAQMGVGLYEIITYTILGIALDSVFAMGAGGPQQYIMDQVRKGAIELDILKPMDFQVYMLAKHIGYLSIQLFLVVFPSLVFAYFFFGLGLPTFVGGVTFLVSLVLACIINFFLKFILGIISMLTMNIQNIMFGFNATQRFFSGQVVPLWLFPGILGTISLYLPFRGIYAIPISLYIGRYTYSQIWEVLGIQLLWILILLLASRMLMSYVFRRLMVQGG